MTAPFIPDAWLLSRNETTPATSSWLTGCPDGATSLHQDHPCGQSCSKPSRAIKPGATQFARIPRGPISRARERVKDSNAAFDAA